MAKKYLRHREDGFIHGWTAALAALPELEEVTEEQAFPERFAPKITKARKAKVNLHTDDIPEPPKVENMDINAELTARTQV